MGNGLCSQVPSCGESPAAGNIDTLIFDIDDTLYDVGTGFTAHRNFDIALKFMVEKLGFATREDALALRNEYFAIYHSTSKALRMAGEQGKLPPMPDGSKRLFATAEFGAYWADNCEFAKYLAPDPRLLASLAKLQKNGMTLVIFTNGPKAYAVKVIEVLGLTPFFKAELTFAVEDVFPACKPEAAAFNTVMKAAKTTASRCVMFEDSMKNIQGCHLLGIKTVLVKGAKPVGKQAEEDTKTAHSMLQPNELPNPDDPSVDATIETAGDLETKLPWLFHAQGKTPWRTDVQT